MNELVVTLEEVKMLSRNLPGANLYSALNETFLHLLVMHLLVLFANSGLSIVRSNCWLLRPVSLTSLPKAKFHILRELHEAEDVLRMSPHYVLGTLSRRKFECVY